MRLRGEVAVSPVSPTHESLTWLGGTIAIQSRDFGPGGGSAPQSAGTPEAGSWWAPTDGGRGYAIEIQRNIMNFAGYIYDTFGNPLW